MRLRAYLIVMAAMILIPGIIFSAIALTTMVNSERKAALNRLNETAHRVSVLVDRELSIAESQLTVLATSPHLEARDFAAFHQQAKAAHRGAHTWVVLVGEDGNQVVNTLVPYGTPLPAPRNRNLTAEILAGGKVHVSNVISGPVANSLVTAISVPVRLKDGRRYVLAAPFRTEHFYRLFDEARMPQRWLAGILDRNGHFVSRSVRNTELVGKPARPELIEATGKQPIGLIRHTTLDGIEVYDAFRRTELSGWAVAVAAPVSVIDEPAHRASWFAVIGMLVAVLCALAATYFSGGRLNRSIRQAANAAVALGHGRSPTVERSSIAEINELNNALTEADRLLMQAREFRAAAMAERATLLENEKNARKAAEAQNRAKDQFLAMLGHELRNPLAPIQTAAALLRLAPRDEHRVNYSSEVISRQVSHMTSLINDLLDVSRVTRGLVTLKKEAVEARDVIAGAVEQAKSLIEAKQHRLNLQLPQEAAWVHGDKTRLVQIFANILHNAAKYTQDKGHIDVTVDVDAEHVRFAIRDNGTGIEPDLLPRLFEPFSQAERTLDRSQGGLGLGLALVKGLVDLHGGSVQVHSDGLGKGSLFEVRLPRLASPAPPATEQADSPDASASRISRVMVVDDNLDAAESLATFLGQFGGLQTSVCINGAEALRRIPVEKPQALVLDIGLPDINGYELARRIRALPVTKDALLIALTGYGTDEDRARAIAAGFDHHLAKPADSALVMELLERCDRDRNGGTSVST